MKDAVAEIMRGVRDIVLPHYGNVSAVSYKRTEGDHDAASAVTELDIRVEETLKEKLSKIDAGIAFVGEETGGDRGADRFWLVDPIDGTGHFIRGMPFCTTMLALVEHGEVVLSGIYNFVSDELYMAEKGKGAICNGKPIHVSERPIGESYLSWETKLAKEQNYKAFLGVKEMGATMFNSVDAGYELTLVASGRIEGRLMFDPYGKDYDFAPGALLVQEAGGVVSNIGTRDYDYRNVEIIAANPDVYKALTEGPDAVFPTEK